MSSEMFRDLFPDFGPGNRCPFVSKGEWAIHELLPILLLITGRANVDIATFSLNEAALRALFLLKDEENITTLRLLADSTSMKHKNGLLLFAESITSNIRISANHAKLLIVQNSDWHIVLMGSANLNAAVRNETGLLMINTPECEFYSHAFNDFFNQATPVTEWI